MKVLVTGAAGFIGSAIAHRLLDRGDAVAGVDNLNDYYDVGLKQARLARLQGRAGFEFHRLAVEDRPAMEAVFDSARPDRIVHLAAQAGVRYSLENPRAYVDANVAGFLSVLECVRRTGTDHLVFASTSSVYGANTRMPFSEQDNVDHPVSLYAATKKANELMAHTYSHLFAIPCTGLRFFTVYGPWGRPDMALFEFTRRMLAGEAIDVYNHGHHTRDFTYIDDIVEGVIRVLDQAPAGNPDWSGNAPDPASSVAPYRLYNIGSNRPAKLLEFIAELERALGVKARRNLLPMQPGDVADTWANVDALARDTGYRPVTTVEQGVRAFVDWYLDYYGHPATRTQRSNA
jgi:UDP-glucuronate 4-epimerase